MKNIYSSLLSIKSLLLFLIIFLFPIFFLPATQEFFIINKLYLLAFGALLLLLISTIQFLISKKLVWILLPFDFPIILFIITIALSIIISSPNKIQAILNPNFGLLSIFSLTVLCFYLSREKTFQVSRFMFRVSCFILSLITILFFFQPFKNVNLPQSIEFLKNPAFTPMGNQLDLAIFLGFFIVMELVSILTALATKQSNFKRLILNSVFLILSCLALSLTLYDLLRPFESTGQILLTPRILSEVGPPFRLSLYAAIEALKNPLTAFFGVGVDNFASIFTHVKDLAYNQSSLWRINSFGISRSTFLHIFTETGIFGLVAFCLLLFTFIIKIFANPQSRYYIPNTIYLLAILVFFPPSLPVFFLFFVLIIINNAKDADSKHMSRVAAKYMDNTNFTSLTHVQEDVSERYILPTTELNFSNLIPIYLGIIIMSFAFIVGASYFLGRSYAAEYYFKKALDGFSKNDAKQIYDNMRQAIILNPYIERFRIDFSQTNILIANNIASKVSVKPTDQAEPSQRSAELTEKNRQNISQAIQAAITEAKAAVALNPQKASNWENLATIYRNILSVAQGADVWTISTYQRAIISDPLNPGYRLNLGGFYYSLGNYEEAVKLFEQSVRLKPDWNNAHYNLAWALFQMKDYQRAASEMQNVTQLVNPTSEDYKNVLIDLENFKKILLKNEATGGGELKPGQLSMPTLPSTTFSPKIQLPKEASPEAK